VGEEHITRQVDKIHPKCLLTLALPISMMLE
jgi:hypothetical protein